MRAKVSLLALSLMFFAAACGRGYEAESEPAPSAMAADAFPVGGYDFVASLGSETRTGTLDIMRSAAGAWSGSATLEGESDAATLHDVVVADRHVTVTLGISQGPVSFELDFTDNDTFTGMIIAGGDMIEVTGHRRQ